MMALLILPCALAVLLVAANLILRWRDSRYVLTGRGDFDWFIFRKMPAQEFRSEWDRLEGAGE